MHISHLTFLQVSSSDLAFVVFFAVGKRVSSMQHCFSLPYISTLDPSATQLLASISRTEDVLLEGNV